VEPIDALPIPADHLRCIVEILENASKSLPGRDGDDDIRGCRQRCDEFIVDPLVVTFCVVQVDKPKPILWI
jgi:hypothetical protein